MDKFKNKRIIIICLIIIFFTKCSNEDKANSFNKYVFDSVYDGLSGKESSDSLKWDTIHITNNMVLFKSQGVCSHCEYISVLEYYNNLYILRKQDHVTSKYVQRIRDLNDLDQLINDNEIPLSTLKKIVINHYNIGDYHIKIDDTSFNAERYIERITISWAKRGKEYLFCSDAFLRDLRSLLAISKENSIITYARYNPEEETVNAPIIGYRIWQNGKLGRKYIERWSINPEDYVHGCKDRCW